MGGPTGVETARRFRAAKDLSPIVFLATSPNFGVQTDFLMDNGTTIPIPSRRRREMTDAYYRFFVTNVVNRGPKKEETYV